MASIDTLDSVKYDHFRRLNPDMKSEKLGEGTFFSHMVFIIVC